MVAAALWSVSLLPPRCHPVASLALVLQQPWVLQLLAACCRSLAVPLCVQLPGSQEASEAGGSQCAAIQGGSEFGGSRGGSE